MLQLIKSKKNRIWEIDFVRGFGIIIMIFIHILYDLEAFYNLPAGYGKGILAFIADIGAMCFIVVSGISTMISRNSLKRGISIFLLGLVITIITYLQNNEFFIVFGILHFMGLCMILFSSIKKLKPLYLIIISIIIGSSCFLIPHIKVSHNNLFFLGFINERFSSSDYYPLLPWSGAFVFGMGISKIFYKDKKSIFKFDLKDNLVNFVGRNSLIIYLVHQPIILGILYIIMK